MWDYTDKVKEYFLHPKNVGEIENPDAEGEVGNMACGDALKLMLKINKDTGVIEDAKFKTFGCGSAIASSSALTEMIIGKTVDEAEKITNKDIADFLGGLPEEKMHCSVMGMEALEKAIADYKGIDVTNYKMHREDLVCKCFEVTEGQIIDVLKKNKITTVSEVTDYTKAGGGCGHCKDKIQEIINKFYIKSDEDVKPKQDEQQKDNLTSFQKMKLIEKVVEEDIKPRLYKDGGSIELIDIKGDSVFVKFEGACKSCANIDNTLKWSVEKILKEKVSSDIEVVKID